MDDELGMKVRDSSGHTCISDRRIRLEKCLLNELSITHRNLCRDGNLVQSPHVLLQLHRGRKVRGHKQPQALFLLFAVAERMQGKQQRVFIPGQVVVFDMYFISGLIGVAVGKQYVAGLKAVQVFVLAEGGEQCEPSLKLCHRRVGLAGRLQQLLYLDSQVVLNAIAALCNHFDQGLAGRLGFWRNSRWMRLTHRKRGSKKNRSKEREESEAMHLEPQPESGYIG
jgi:hypothetical protein